MNLFDAMERDVFVSVDEMFDELPEWLWSIEASLDAFEREFDVDEWLTVVHVPGLPRRYLGGDGDGPSMMTLRDVRCEVVTAWMTWDFVNMLSSGSIRDVWGSFEDDVRMVKRVDVALSELLTAYRNPAVVLPRREMPRPRFVTTLELPVVEAVVDPSFAVTEREARDIVKMLSRR